MKKIAMLNCLKANEICTGASCFRAFLRKEKSFERYRNEETELAAFFRCNGCGRDPLTDAGIQEKLQRLQEEHIEVVHVGVCTKDRAGKRCETIQKIVEQLESRGISVVDGTH